MKVRNKGFLKFLVLSSLVSVLLVILLGGIVRVTESGMGCPDWPRCFGQWIPPTAVDQLPVGYDEIFFSKRISKLEKYTSYLEKVGMKSIADDIRNEPQEKLTFSVRSTWIEYINRLFGFLAGNFILLLFLYSCLYFRTNPLYSILSFLVLVITGFQAWFGSIVVATNLMQGTISIHFFLAILIVLLLVHIYHIVDRKQMLIKTRRRKLYVFLMLVLILIQFVLGTEVRKELDLLIDSGTSRFILFENPFLLFIFHRSFLWLFLGLLFLDVRQLIKENLFRGWNVVYVSLILLQIVIGLVLYFFGLPKVAQVLHLLVSSLMIAVTYLVFIRLKVSDL